MTTGRLIVVEGPDGSGKTTQARMLAEALAAEGREVQAVREPGGTALGEALRRILLEGRPEAIDERAEACLFLAARAELVAEVIRPALEADRIVVSDRFGLSTLVYQGYRNGAFDPQVAQMVRYACGGLEPDLTIVLDATPEVARARLGAERDRMEAKGAAYHARVREGYLAAVREGGPRFVLIDGGEGTPEAVFAQVRRAVERVLEEARA